MLPMKARYKELNRSQGKQWEAAQNCNLLYGWNKPKSTLDNSLGDDNILVWNRKVEQYLADFGIPYTIIGG
ncbi:hypothetical protein CMV_016026 [Castanea mollissima]|uniref:Uncharacterized protein n=1 Tax=Castanea mollissima TaxID=60419 RepID=A0A8J4VS33_9ROSI|nr:hypothetical protein CMV_016026 [Castanea mollissima]